MNSIHLNTIVDYLYDNEKKAFEKIYLEDCSQSFYNWWQKFDKESKTDVSQFLNTAVRYDFNHVFVTLMELKYQAI